MPNSSLDASLSEIYLLSGVQDPSVTATNGVKGTIFTRVGPNGGTLYQKQDDGVSTNWSLIGGGGGGGISSINGQTQAAQFIASNSTGTSPSINSVGGTHFVQIPSASAVGVTEGTVGHDIWSAVSGSSSAPDYQVFVSIDGSDVTGNGSLLKPYRTMNAAISYIDSLGDFTNNWTVFVGPGDYSSDPAFSITRPKTHVVGTTGAGPDAKATIIGIMTIQPSFSFGGVANSVISLSNLLISPPAFLAQALRLTGFQACTLIINNCFIYSGSAGAAYGFINDQSGVGSRIFCTNSIISTTAGTGNAVQIQDGSFRTVNTRIYAGSGNSVNFSAGSTGILAVCELTSTGAEVASVSASTVFMSECTATSPAANSTAVNLVSGGVLYATSSAYNVPIGSGFAVKGTLGCVYYNALNVYVQNPKVSNAMGAGVINLSTAYVLA